MECRRSTEFHFENIVQQIHNISKEFPTDDQGHPILKAGDFFTTKHSNLKSYHVIFHLIIDKSRKCLSICISKTQNVLEWSDKPSSQSPEIMGYRSILSVAHACDVTTLTLPVDLCPLDKILPDLEFSRRVETVLKSTKGTLMELNHFKNEKGKTGGAGHKFIFRYENRDINQIASLLTGVFQVA